MARSTASADAMLTSCSAERPPAKIPTRSRGALIVPTMPASSAVGVAQRSASPQSPTNSISYASSTPKRSRDRGADVVAERAHVGGAAAAVDDDEVRVQGADLAPSRCGGP